MKYVIDIPKGGPMVLNIDPLEDVEAGYEVVLKFGNWERGELALSLLGAKRLGQRMLQDIRESGFQEWSDEQ